MPILANNKHVTAYLRKSEEINEESNRENRELFVEGSIEKIRIAKQLRYALLSLV